MLDWFRENAAVVSALVNIAMLFVWLFYARIFYREFRRQRSVLLFIHQSQGYSLDSFCLLVNLSSEPVHVLGVMVATPHRSGATLIDWIPDKRSLADPQEADGRLEDLIHQGPLGSGEYFSLGTFREMLRGIAGRARERAGDDRGRESSPEQLLAELEAIEVRVVAIHGAREFPVGAYRRFEVIPGPEPEVRPTMLFTHQMTSRGERRQVRQWLAEAIADRRPRTADGRPQTDDR